MAEVEETLARVPMFSGVKPKELKKLGKRMSERSFNEGDEITREGESGIGFFVIEHGNATVSVAGAIVRTLGPGDHFGEEHPEVAWALLETLVRRLREAQT
jgi:CRP-like cAMP-binding protein